MADPARSTPTGPRGGRPFRTAGRFAVVVSSWTLAACTALRAGPVRALEPIAPENAGRVTLLATIEAHSDWARCVAFRPDGRVLASGGKEGAVRLWEVPSGRPLATLRGHTC